MKCRQTSMKIKLCVNHKTFVFQLEFYNKRQIVQRKAKTCEILINRRVLIFAAFIVHLNHENKNPIKYNFPIDCCL